LTHDDILERFGLHFPGKCTCPAHDDRNPSLSITERDGKLLFYCHSGCATEDVLAAVGLSFSDIGSGRDEPEAVYLYTDEQGDTLFEVLRYPDKKFLQRRIEPETRETVWGLNGTRRVLYRLPGVLRAVEYGETIYVCEGEKDAEALRRAGKCATCNPGGAGKWKDEYSEFLRDANVIIVADKDEPGMQHAAQVWRSLERVSRAVYVVQAKDGKDAADHLEAGHAVEEFVRVNLGDPRRHYQPLDLFQPVPDVDWVIENIVVGGEATLLVADGGAGKSFFALAASLAVAAGIPFIGCSTKQGRVMYVDEEGSPALALQRLEQLGASTSQKQQLDYLNFVGVDMLNHPEKLIEDAQLVAPKLIVIDSHAKVSRMGEENSNDIMGRVWNDGLLKLARDTGAAVLVIHHTSSEGSRARGATQIRNSADQVLTMERQLDGTQKVWASKPRRLTSTLHFEFRDMGHGQYRLEPVRVAGVFG
jgi:5S rRNA maturation endonuclease (ribonuclease M5)